MCLNFCGLIRYCCFQQTKMTSSRLFKITRGCLPSTRYVRVRLTARSIELNDIKNVFSGLFHLNMSQRPN